MKDDSRAALPSPMADETGPIRESDVDGIRTIELTAPPVNTVSRTMRTALFLALMRAEADPTVRGVILRGAGKGFCGGADIEEFDTSDALAEPTLHETIARTIEAMRTPIVAAMHGFALGGGLELALLCHFRVAATGTRVGLPEITLGFLPGAGGTQRLVRALPLERAISHLLMGDGFMVDAEPEGAIVDEVVAASELDAAARRLIDGVNVAQPLPRLRDVELDAASGELVIAAAEQLLEKQRLLSPAVAGILNAVRAGLSDIDAGLVAEFQAFQSLAGSSAARASRYRFKALRAVRRRPTIAHAITSAAVIGAGTMGRGIAEMLVGAGVHVTIVDTDPKARSETIVAVGESATGLVAGAASISELPPVDLVIEAVIEDLDVKRQVFAELSAHLSAECILATNTSSLDLDQIAGAAVHPERVLGLHFFSPVSRMPLVEVVQGARTNMHVIERSRALLLAAGKTPVVVSNAPSFVGNRIFDRYLEEALVLHLEGATVTEIDDAAIAIGMPAGPFRVLDGIGIDVPHRGREQRGTAEAPEWSVARVLVQEGRLGRKSGSGWYRYGQERGADPRVEDIAARVRVDLGIERRKLLAFQIQERLRMSLISESRAVVAAGIARSAADVDVIMTLGYGFPVDQGGPVFLARQMGDGLVDSLLARLEADAAGPFSARWSERLPAVEGERAA